MPAPVLHTTRLTLRGHTLADLDALGGIYAGPRAQYICAPMTPVDAWRWMASEVGMWDLRGFGYWGIETRDGTFLGQIGLSQPPHFPEPELGWVLLDSAEGKGYAFEAASAALAWAWGKGLESLVSYITPGNDRSVSLAERLGAVHDPRAPLPENETPEETLVYRHLPDNDGSPEAYA